MIQISHIKAAPTLGALLAIRPEGGDMPGFALALDGLVALRSAPKDVAGARLQAAAGDGKDLPDDGETGEAAPDPLMAMIAGPATISVPAPQPVTAVEVSPSGSTPVIVPVPTDGAASDVAAKTIEAPAARAGSAAVPGESTSPSRTQSPDSIVGLPAGVAPGTPRPEAGPAESRSALPRGAALPSKDPIPSTPAVFASEDSVQSRQLPLGVDRPDAPVAAHAGGREGQRAGGSVFSAAAAPVLPATDAPVFPAKAAPVADPAIQPIRMPISTVVRGASALTPVTASALPKAGAAGIAPSEPGMSIAEPVPAIGKPPLVAPGTPAPADALPQPVAAEPHPSPVAAMPAPPASTATPASAGLPAEAAVAVAGAIPTTFSSVSSPSADVPAPLSKAGDPPPEVVRLVGQARIATDPSVPAGRGVTTGSKGDPVVKIAAAVERTVQPKSAAPSAMKPEPAIGKDATRTQLDRRVATGDLPVPTPRLVPLAAPVPAANPAIAVGSPALRGIDLLPAMRRERATSPLLAPAAEAVIQTAAAAPVEAVEVAQQPVLDTQAGDWIEGMIEKIEVLRDARAESGTATARIRLSPDALGAVELVIADDADGLDIRIHAESPAARALLADAAPRLAEMAESRGLKLGQSNIDAGEGQRHAERQQQQESPTRNHRREAEADAAPSRHTPERIA